MSSQTQIYFYPQYSAQMLFKARNNVPGQTHWPLSAIYSRQYLNEFLC